MSTYGPFSVILYARVKKLKLFEISDSSNFLEKLIEFYSKNAREISKNDALKNIKTLISLFPSPKRFTKLLGFHRAKGRDMIFFKLALDIMTFYYKTIESPLFIKLQREIIPLALNFYKIVGTSVLKEIISELLANCGSKSIFLHVL